MSAWGAQPRRVHTQTKIVLPSGRVAGDAQPRAKQPKQAMPQMGQMGAGAGPSPRKWLGLQLFDGLSIHKVWRPTKRKVGLFLKFLEMERGAPVEVATCERKEQFHHEICQEKSRPVKAPV